MAASWSQPARFFLRCAALPAIRRLRDAERDPDLLSMSMADEEEELLEERGFLLLLERDWRRAPAISSLEVAPPPFATCAGSAAVAPLPHSCGRLCASGGPATGAGGQGQ